MNPMFQTLTRHRIALEGLPLVFVAVLAVVAAWLLWRLYQRELGKLDPKARRTILALRLTALVLIVLAFANPTWETITAEVQKPLVAVAIDNSQSMDLADGAMRPEEMVRMALALGIMDRATRSSSAEEAAQELRAAGRELDDAAAVWQAASQRVTYGPAEPSTKDQVKKACDEGGRAAGRCAGRVDKAILLTRKLEDETGFDPALLRRAGDIRLQTERLSGVVLGGFLKTLYRDAAAFEPRRREILRVREAFLETQDTLELMEEMTRELDELQARLDRRLFVTAPVDLQAKMKDLCRLTRREALARLLAAPGGFMATLKEKYRFRFYALNDTVGLMESASDTVPAWTAAGVGTDIGSALIRLSESLANENLAGVVLFSDGRHTDGPPPVETAGAVAALGVPLHAVGVGSVETPVDVAVGGLQVPESVFAGEPVAPTALVRFRGLEGREISAAFFMDGKEVERKNHVIAAKSVSVEIPFAAIQLPVGEHRLAVTLAAVPGEAIAANNRIERSVRVTDRKTRVLVLEGNPRRQLTELCAALRSEPNLDIREVVAGTQPERRMEMDESLQLRPGKSRRLRRGAGPGEFPESAEALFEYDLIVMGDFPVAELTYEEQQNIVDFVQSRGGTLVLCAGPQANPLQYETSTLGEILPVSLPFFESDDAPLAFQPYHQDGYRIELTPAGRGDPLCRLLPGQQANQEAWEKLPACFWRFPSLEARPDATVLVRAAASRKEPLVVTRPAGLGRVLYVGMDDVWRWRAADDSYPARFWGNVLRWSAAGGASERSRHVGIALGRRRCGAGEAVIVGAQVRNDERGGVDNDVLEAQVLPLAAAAGAEAPLATARLEPVAASPGLYRGEISGLAEGDYLVRLTSSLYRDEAARLAPIRLTVGRDPSLEYLEPTLNRPLLEELADEGGGRYFTVDRAADILQALPAGSNREVTQRVGRSLWGNYPFLAALLLLFAGEWIWRKLRGLL